MEFFDVIKERYSVRKFKSTPVLAEDVEKILAAGHLAPTGRNMQPQRILVLNSEESLAKLKLCTASHFNAPLAMLVCYDKKVCWPRKFDGKTSGVSDACIVCTHMMLAATDIGVGSTWVMSFDPKAMREQFQIPESFEPVALLVMGYATEDCEPRYDMHNTYRPLEETVFYNKF